LAVFLAVFLTGFFFTDDFLEADFFRPEEVTFFFVTLRFLATVFLAAAFLDVAFFREAGALVRFLPTGFFLGIFYSCRTEKRRGLYIDVASMEAPIFGPI
jgi:hypothetical protein